MRSCGANVEDLAAAMDQGLGHNEMGEIIDEKDAVPPKDVIIVGYSKGVPDTLRMLVKRPDLAKRVRCFYAWAGALGGTYLVDDIYQSIQHIDLPNAEEVLKNLLLSVYPVITEQGLLRRFDEFDMLGALKDLCTFNATAFWDKNKETINDLGIPIFNITGSTTVLDVPFFQVQGVLSLNKYDANNDMQVTQSKSKIHMPMATDLAMFNAHHWDMSYDPFPKTMLFSSKHVEHPFPKEAAMTAIIQLAAELGLID